MGFLNRYITKPIVTWLNQENSQKHLPLSDFEKIRGELKPCDVLLVEGRTRISNVIRIITQSSWTHAALYIGRIKDIEDPKFRTIVANNFKGDPESQLVIESLLGRGTVVNPLSNYQHDHLRICRPRGLIYKDSQQAINFSISRVGLAYDFRQILDLARFLFPWALWPRRWRSTLFQHNAGPPTKTVCSTMIAEAFHYIQFPILPLVRMTDDQGIKLYRRNPKLCVPRDFDHSPYFEIIKYPFIDCCDYGSYRLLPWHGSTPLTSNDQIKESDHQTNEAVIDPVKERLKEDELLESYNAQQRRENDPLIEEILGNASKLAEFPTRDVPIEDLNPENDSPSRKE